jgi:PAS domain S-box-containing protein
MRKDFPTISQKETPNQAAIKLQRTDFSCIPVTDSENCVKGYITKDHLLKLFTNDDLNELPISNIMNTNVITVRKNDKVSLLEKNHDRSVFAVIDNHNSLKGLITENELTQYYYDYNQEILEELNTVLKSTRNGIIAVNNKGIITIFNQAASEIIGIHSSEAIGKNVENVLPDKSLLNVMKTSESQIAHQCKINGTDIISNRTPLLNDGKTIGAIGIFQDKSDLESISQELEYTKNLNRELDTIIESISDGL